MVLLDFVDKLTNSVENYEITIGIFVNLANNKTLLAKLHHYGIRGIAFQWNQNNLSNRNQFVCVNHFQSDPVPVVCGALSFM